MRYYFLGKRAYMAYMYDMRYKIFGIVFLVFFVGGIALGFKGHPPQQRSVHRSFRFELPSTGGVTSQSLAQVKYHGDIAPVVPSQPIHPLIHHSVQKADQGAIQQESTSQ